jgi:hypothetical protein
MTNKTNKGCSKEQPLFLIHIQCFRPVKASLRGNPVRRVPA